MHIEYKVKADRAYPLGAFLDRDGLHISAVCDCADPAEEGGFGVMLYDRRHKNGIRIPFPQESRVGGVYSMLLADYQDKDCRYLLYCGGRMWQDPYCRKVDDPYRYGAVKSNMPRCMIQGEAYDWGGDRPLRCPYEDMILYALHVRGFTKHRSSGVEHKGTYCGITEKIPYLADLGITSILLMPCYEFDEVMDQDFWSGRAPMEQGTVPGRQAPLNTDADGGTASGAGGRVRQRIRLNYWGYQEGLYYVPKSSYAYGKDPVGEYKDMVKALHRNGIEVLMQFYFPPGVTSIEMLDILKYWVIEYHIDGFHVMGVDLPIELFAKDPFLSDTKILTEQQYSPNAEDRMSRTRCLGWLNDGFLFDVRRVLKGDDNMINQLIYHMRNNRPENGIVNYIAKWDGMRLADIVSYDRKHNENNGEANQDGSDYNCSWNCGVEGRSRRKNITDLRLRQMKNALTLVFLSQGTPLLYSGDEFGNTQEGNNNPYCQDNAVAWIKWNRSEDGNALLGYTKRLIAFRRAHPILHSPAPLKGMDYLSCGYPDISFHGHEAWRPDTSPASRSIGVMYCGRYGITGGAEDDKFIFIGVNLYWTAYRLGLPQLPKGMEWTLYASTDPQDMESDPTKERSGTEGPMQEICVKPRTIVIYVAEA